MQAKFSVAMCTYNGAAFVAEQLASIAAQRRLPDELIVCDDRSTDATVECIREFARSAPFPVRLVVNEKNVGSTKNFERAIALCDYELIALADQDDVWLPDKLKAIEARFQAEPAAGVVFSDAELVDESLCSLGERLWHSIGFDEKQRAQLNSSKRCDVLLPGWTVTGATMAFRSQFRTLALPIPDDLQLLHDGWIAGVIGCVAEVSFLEEPLIKYRQHQQQQVGASQPGMSEPKNLRGTINRTNPYGRLISIAERVRARLVEHGEEFDCTTALQRLDERIYHLRTREGLPHSRLRRFPHVVRELLTQRYQNYSNGFYSALKDLVTSTPNEVVE